MKEAILLIHFTDRARRKQLIKALLPLKLPLKEIPQEDYGKRIGYLAGMKELGSDEIGSAGEELSGELLVMAGLSSQRMDQVVRNIRKSGIYIPYKAVLTPSNQSWNVWELFDEIKKEHEKMSGGGD